MKKIILKTLSLFAIAMLSFSTFTSAGDCTDTGLKDNGCTLYDCEDSTLKECPDGSKTVIVAASN